MTLTLDLSEASMKALGSTPGDAASELRLAAAMKLHEIGRLSSGAAAALAGIPRVEFLSKLGQYGVSAFQVTPDELAGDVDTALRYARRNG